MCGVFAEQCIIVCHLALSGAVVVATKTPLIVRMED